MTCDALNPCSFFFIRAYTQGFVNLCTFSFVLAVGRQITSLLLRFVILKTFRFDKAYR